jgi:hypothetical protein
MYLGSRAWPVRRADNFTAICEPIAQTVYEPLQLTTLRPPRPVTGIARLYSETAIIQLDSLS